VIVLINQEVKDETRFTNLLLTRKENFINSENYLKFFIKNEKEKFEEELIKFNPNTPLINNKNDFGDETDIFLLNKTPKIKTKTTSFNIHHKKEAETKTPVFTLDEKSETNEGSSKKIFIRESPKHKTSPSPQHKLSEIKSKSKLKHSKTTPLIIISKMFNFKMITSHQRGYLKDLLIDGDSTLKGYLEKYEEDGDLNDLYENISNLIN